MSRIIFLSGWSNCGGSTEAFCHLTNALNDAGYNTIFMGPHDYPLKFNKCKFEQVITGSKLNINKEDTLIVHFKNNFTQRPPIKGFFLSCHEQDIFPLVNIQYNIFDKIHYVSEHQRKFHGLSHPYFVIPNILDDVKPNEKPIGKIGGIIGSIDPNKQVHISIQNAIKDGCEKVYIYGLVTDTYYWHSSVSPLVDGTRVIYKGYEENKQKMYDSFTDLYFSSVRECAPYVLGEAKMAGKKIHAIEGKNYLGVEYEFDKDKIVEKWVDEMNITKNVYINLNVKPKISAYFVCYNEEQIMPHLLRHYTSFCDKVTILDNCSTDRTEEIVKKFKNVVIEKFDSHGSFNDGANAHVKNNSWKKDIGDFDYIIAADSDEFIWHPNFLEFLQEKKEKGYTLFRPFGYHMVGDIDLILKEDDDIFEKVKYGVNVASMHKYIIFDCNKIKETNFSVGSHACNPIGDVKLYYKDDLKLKHFKYLGLENHLNQCRMMKQRLSQFNIQHNMATYYLEGDEYHTKDYMNYFNQRVLI